MVVTATIYGPCGAKSNRGGPPRGLRIAPNSRLRQAPIATVRPIPRSTGAAENDRIPKPITVQRSARTSEAIMRECARLSVSAKAALEEQAIVGADRSDQQQSEQIEDRQPVRGRQQKRSGADHRGGQRQQHRDGPARRSQADRQQDHDGNAAGQRKGQRLVQISAKQPVGLRLEVEKTGPASS